MWESGDVGERTCDTYRTLVQPGTAAFKERGSRFLGEAAHVQSADEAQEALAAIRRRERGATHHCWACRLGADRFRYDDDGEPSGTAGAPILRQIDGRGLTHVLVVVTRYYGGTKLGTGGLARAYGAAAAQALEAARVAARVAERVLRTPLRLRFAYDDTAPARQTLSRFDAELTGETYAEATTWHVAVRRSQAEAFVQAFTNALGGRATVREEGVGKKDCFNGHLSLQASPA